MVAGPGGAGDEEEGLVGDEFDVILIEGGVEFDHCGKVQMGLGGGEGF